MLHECCMDVAWVDMVVAWTLHGHHFVCDQAPTIIFMPKLPFVCYNKKHIQWHTSTKLRWCRNLAKKKQKHHTRTQISASTFNTSTAQPFPIADASDRGAHEQKKSLIGEYTDWGATYKNHWVGRHWLGSTHQHASITYIILLFMWHSHFDQIVKYLKFLPAKYVWF